MRLYLALVFLILTTSAAHAETIAGRASVIDADTLEIHGQRIRILDIDAPESRQTCWRFEEPGNLDRYQVEWRCGQQAAIALADWIGELPVTCEATKKDRYKRWLAR